MSIKYLSQAKKDRSIQILSFVLFGLIVFTLHLYAGTDQRDDLWFAQQLDKYSFFSYLKMRYATWTSRLLIEGALVWVVSKNVWVWRILNTLAVLLLAYSFAGILLPKGKEKWTPFVLPTLFLIPLSTLSSAGFAATTINYIWPLACMLFAIYQSVKIIRGEKGTLLLQGLGLIASIFAASMEQVATVMAGVCIAFLILIWIREKRIDIYTNCLLGISILEMLFALTCPGNAQRALVETDAHFPEYVTAGFIEKLEMGFLSESAYYFGTHETNYILLVFSFVLCFILWKQKKILPLILQLPGLFFGLFWRGIRFLSRFGILFNHLNGFRNIYPASFCDFTPWKVFLEEMVFLTFWILLVYGIYQASTTPLKSLIGICLLSAGFFSRLILGFSPSIYISGYRTALIMSVSILMTAWYLIEPWLPSDQESM